MEIQLLILKSFKIRVERETKGRFVGINLMKGTKMQIELILSLAYNEENKKIKD